ncbi:MAG: hypothetical protein LCH79_16135 [Proteobacteria bacterium]|nr:hypothetical protein [Pseudomonadota bacterium]
MASKPSSNPLARVLTNYRGANREAAGRYLGELANRQRAARILNPTEVGGEYDAGRLLTTTMGGHLHAITHEDLRTFRQNVQLLGKRFRGGITAKAIIDLSLPEDRERANREIKTAVPMQSIGGRVHFITNAGPKSDVARHHVHVEFLTFSAAVSSPGPAADLVKPVVSGALKFDCDCGRHTYWYRYIATVGKYNSGRDETGFPKIRNPNLRGVACKHILRVMQQLSMPIIKQQIARMIENARENLDKRPKVLSKKQAEQIAEQQRAQETWKRSKVETTSEKRQRLAQARAVAAVVERARAAPAGKVTPRSVESAKKQFVQKAKTLAAMGVLSPKQLQTMLAKLG